jgi:predicted molibdopterin-dependent oxidoreductase YjgC
MNQAITLSIDTHSISVEEGVTVAAAIARAAEQAGQRGITRHSVSGAARAPLCGMGVCQECRVTINGRQHQLACQTLCAPGMDVRTGVAPAAQEFAA